MLKTRFRRVVPSREKRENKIGERHPGGFNSIHNILTKFCPVYMGIGYIILDSCNISMWEFFLDQENNGKQVHPLSEVRC